MLAIRLQRLGRKQQPVYRVAVQDSSRHPSSGRVVAYVGTYNPHTKATQFDNEKVSFYLNNGAQPSPRVIRLLENEKVTLPSWVSKAAEKKRIIRNPEKLRKNQPKNEEATETSEASDTQDQSAES